MFLRDSFNWASFSGISWAPGDDSHVPEEELKPAFRSAVYGKGGRGKARFYSPEVDEELQLHRDDQVAQDFIVLLVTRGFFDEHIA